MSCPECRGELFTQGQFDVAQMFHMDPILVRNVPAQRCDQCGYLIISAEVGRQIEGVLKNHEITGYAPAAVYDLAAPRRAPQTAAGVFTGVEGTRIE